jgi:nucleotide-binding universal stress UspA family protein
MKILLALDTSAASSAALKEVVDRPWPEGSSFGVLSIIEPSHVHGTDTAIRQVVHRVNEFVTNAVESLRSRGWESGGGALADDDPKVVILDRARSIHADLVVIGSRGHSSVSRLMIGSVGALLRRAPCSVEIVRESRRPAEIRPGKKILLATDGSESANGAALSIASRPWSVGTEIRVFSVPETLLSARRALLEVPFLASAMETARAEGVARSQNALESAVRILNGRDYRVSSGAASLSESVHRAILEEHQTGKQISSSSARGASVGWIDFNWAAFQKSLHCMPPVLLKSFALQVCDITFVGRMPRAEG